MATAPLCAALTDALLKVDQACASLDKLGGLKPELGGYTKHVGAVRSVLVGELHKSVFPAHGPPHVPPAAPPVHLFPPPVGPSPGAPKPRRRDGEGDMDATPAKRKGAWVREAVSSVLLERC